MITKLETEGFIISREEFAELTRLYTSRINSKNVGRIPAIFNSIRSHLYQSERDKVLDELLVILEKLSNKDRTAYVPANVEKTTIERIISIVKELRQAGEP